MQVDSARATAMRVERKTNKTSGDLIFSASRVRLTLFQAYMKKLKMQDVQAKKPRTGVTEVKIQG